jgi:hypothetical protein
LWKVACCGLDWALSDNLRNTLWGCWACRDDFQPLFRLDRYPPLCRLAALATLSYELGFVFALPVRRLRPWPCILGIFFHAGIASVLPKLGLSCDEIEVEQCLVHTDPDRRGEPPLVVAPYASWRNAPGAPIRVSDARLPLEQHFPPGYRLVFSSASFRKKVEFAIRRICRLL